MRATIHSLSSEVRNRHNTIAGSVTTPITQPHPAKIHQLHAGNPSIGTHLVVHPTILATNTPTIPPLNIPAKPVKHPTPR
jgi:hypothetical protein